MAVRGVTRLEVVKCAVDVVALQPVVVAEAVVVQGERRQGEVFQDLGDSREVGGFVIFAVDAEAQAVFSLIVVPELYGKRFGLIKAGEQFGIGHALLWRVFFAVGEAEDVVKAGECFFACGFQLLVILRVPFGKCLQSCVDAGFLAFSHVAAPVFFQAIAVCNLG